MLKHRLIFGSLMVAALVALLYADNRLGAVALGGDAVGSGMMGLAHLPPGLLILAVVLGLIVLATGELHAMFERKGVPTDRWLLALGGCVGCLMLYLMPATRMPEGAVVALVATMLGLLLLVTLLRLGFARQQTQGMLAAGGAMMLTIVYLGLLPGMIVALRADFSAWVVAAVLLTTKACDIGAYFTGRAVGRRKLIPWLSPGKTWEGLIGGMVLAGIVAGALAAVGNAGHHLDTQPLPGEPLVAPKQLHILAAIAIGLLLGGIGQLGDLVASMFKRDAQLKDSANTIPGFGGVLDVVDSPLITAPLAYWLLHLMVTGG